MSFMWSSAKAPSSSSPCTNSAGCGPSSTRRSFFASLASLAESSGKIVSCMQRSYRYGRKGKQVHPQVSERRQQFVRFSGIVSHGCGEVVDASYMKRHSSLQAVQGVSVIAPMTPANTRRIADKHTAADDEC